MLPLPSGFEWIVILVIALLILGPGKLPDVASAVGKSIREFRKASSEVQEAVKVDTSPLPAAPAAATTQAAPPAQAVATPPVATPAVAMPAVPEAPVAPPPAAQSASSEVTTEAR